MRVGADLPRAVLPTSMIGTELLRELIDTVILTANVQNSELVSLLLIAAPESGKTSIVLAKECKSIQAFADITGGGIHQVIKNNKDLTHIVINDMVSALSHRESVNRYLIAQLNAITEEGITSIATPHGVEKFECGKRGVIASLTLDLVKDSRRWWNKIGFTSRMLPFCYSYPARMLIEIKAAIDAAQTNGHKSKKKSRLIVSSNKINVAYPPELLKEIHQIADVRSIILQEQGIRRLKQYHALAQAHAILRSRTGTEVTQKDVDFIRKIDAYVSYDKPEPL